MAYVDMITLGIDIGSIITKAALIRDRQLLEVYLQPTGHNVREAGRQAFERILSQARLESRQVAAVVTTGYGRNSFPLNHKAVTEITCHAAGAHFLAPQVRSVIDIGGQDAKALTMDSSGRVSNFVMNDKCAAGTGRFLEVMARALEISLEEMGVLSLKAAKAAGISSTCTVFAESEVISLLSRGEPRENIIAGLHASIAVRMASMGRRVGLSEPVMMTGGVAKNSGVVRALEKELGYALLIDNHAQVIGAIGAALMAIREFKAS
jgi:predicted CoA-substrate-specific enzyme activase